MENRYLRTRPDSGHQDYPLPDRDAEAMERMCRILEQGEITSGDLIYSGSNIVLMVSLLHKGKVFPAVYKPRRGESPLWDFPDGTLYKREYATYLFSQALNWRLVPPTVIRDGPHGVGSLQLFVDTNVRINYDALWAKHFSELRQTALFDYLVNNADRKIGHCLPGQDGRLWLIDHGLTFNVMPKLRTVIWDFSGQAIPEKMVSEVAELHRVFVKGKSLRKSLSRLINEKELAALENRITRILQNPVFPYPESRRSVPWPWI